MILGLGMTIILVEAWCSTVMHDGAQPDQKTLNFSHVLFTHQKPCTYLRRPLNSAYVDASKSSLVSGPIFGHFCGGVHETRPGQFLLSSDIARAVPTEFCSHKFHLC